MTCAAVFWDRDGTLIEDPGYLSSPEQVKLLPGAAEALRQLSEAGYQNIIATNQSGLARGLFDESTLERIHQRLGELLAAQGARVDAIYYCPYLDGDQAVVPKYRADSDLRKPKPGMLLQAASERNIDLAGSWSIGNSLSDAEAGRAAGCRTILVTGDPEAQLQAKKHRAVDFVAGSLSQAAQIVLRHTPRSAAEPTRGEEPETTTVILRDILNFLRAVDRRGQRDDFSLTRLAGAVTQILALGVLVWAFFGLIASDPWHVQVIRLLYVLVLQLVAMTFLMLSGRR